MSGGVDSSVTACLLREQGYEVEGLSFILYEARLKNTFPGCCSVESIRDAGRTAERIGVPHTAMDLRDEFMTYVIEPFIEAYARGVTPNPCILCNRHIKFPFLLRQAGERGAEFIATGHYARVKDSEELTVRSNELSVTGEDNSSRLLKGIDSGKDQSYVLYVLRPGELSRLVLPLGEKRKDEVRKIARALDLPAAKRPESQEICFIEDRNYSKFIDKLLPEERGAGRIIDIIDGKVLGMHKGIHTYTIGQRKGLGISSPEPLYVVRIDTGSNSVYVGPRDAAMMKEFVVEEVNWLSPPITHFTPPFPPLGKGGMGGVASFRASVKVRSMMKDEAATITILDHRTVKVVFDEPQWAPAPGQSAVFYDGDVVMGGGVITG